MRTPYFIGAHVLENGGPFVVELVCDASVRIDLAEGLLHHAGGARQLLGDQTAGDHRVARQEFRDLAHRHEHGKASFTALRGGLWAYPCHHAL